MPVTTLTAPCYASRALAEGFKVQCQLTGGHLDAHYFTYGSQGFGWNGGLAQCAVIHAINGVRCLHDAVDHHAHNGLSRHNGDWVKWHREATQEEAEAENAQNLQWNLDYLNRYGTVEMPGRRYDFTPIADAVPPVAGLQYTQFDRELFERAMAQFVGKQTGEPLDPDTGLTAHDAMPDRPEARTYAERKKRRK